MAICFLSCPLARSRLPVVNQALVFSPNERRPCLSQGNKMVLSHTAPMTPIQVARPRLSSASAITPYLREIDANAWYSNQGPLVVRLQARLGVHWGVEAQEVSLLTNATSALTLALQASGAKAGTRCLMPSWTFVASAGAVVAAGLIPHFVDVLPSTWAPDPSIVERLARQPDVGAILIVAPFGAPIDLAVWDAVQRRTGVVVIIDAAAAFDALRVGGPMQAGECPVIVSLHATKSFGIGEGGALLSRNPELMRRVRSLQQFGFFGSRSAQHRGVNAKISEYTAAVGLAGLDGWDQTRSRWDRITQAYRAMLPRDLTVTPGFGQDWIASTLTVLWPGNRANLQETLAAEGISTLSWWGPGCHAQPAYSSFGSEALPVTQTYARRAVGLPFWQDLTISQIETICTTLHRILGHHTTRKRAAVKALVDS
jgi:dTDP-4-amino-4,6-dideoxygalactose transaminase